MIPQLDFVDDSTCVAYTEDGFLVFEGTDDPVETVSEWRKVRRFSVSAKTVNMWQWRSEAETMSSRMR